MSTAIDSFFEREAAQITAKILLEIKAVNFRPQQPYTLTSGWKSPVYIDCRKIISFPHARKKLMQLAGELITRHIGYESIDVVAGGETAGIPFAAWIAEKFSAPMIYVRKKPKGFGRNAQIEGIVPEGMKTLLVEDLTTDGGSKLRFAKALRDTGATVTDTFVVFYYGVFPGAEETLAQSGLKLHSLATWQDVLEVCKTGSYFSKEDVKEVENFLKDPCKWSKDNGGVGSIEEAQKFKHSS